MLLWARGKDSRSFAFVVGSKRNSIGGYQRSGALLARLPAEEKMSQTLKSAISRSHEEATIESFRKDPAFAAEYLNAVLEDGDQEELMLAIHAVCPKLLGAFKNSPGGRS